MNAEQKKQLVSCGFVNRIEKCENCGKQTKKGFTFTNKNYENKFVCSESCGQKLIDEEGVCN